MAVVFPAAFWDRDCAAAVPPFTHQSFYATPLFEKLIMPADGAPNSRANLDERTVVYVKILHTYAHILKNFYDIMVDSTIRSSSQPQIRKLIWTCTSRWTSIRSFVKSKRLESLSL